MKTRKAVVRDFCEKAFPLLSVSAEGTIMEVPSQSCERNGILGHMAFPASQLCLALYADLTDETFEEM